ncbi:aminoglycoside phosphotransferase family protein [Neptuniibacter sp. 2_MG-2023]|uniref:aminoglycoside phosphotransferase family protein n=1 Tax=Neptuniibacter sp. 2_MG-2023 TaxID=3062671 RepID=UPI0026E1682C|nr:phosphotransferase [Neptuniibacter sp. 2_MG-2023]MDO6512990.1 phosphotransferase [Neptuniibacter sp. 2_MG-2023]
MDQRYTQLKQWLERELLAFNLFDISDWQLLPVSGDASFRRYFRAKSNGASWIAVDAPPEKEDSQPFVAIAAELEKIAVSVPHVHKYDLQQGFMLLEDFGDDLYLSKLNKSSVEPLYADALESLLIIQSCKPAVLPLYDRALLDREVELFREWFLQKLLEIKLDADEQQMLRFLFNYVIDSALEQPLVFVHRDFHSRNLMYREGKAPGVIDFQDAVEGPVTYDLASILRDCYISWPDDQVYRWVEQYRLSLIENGQIMPDPTHFVRWFDLMGAQRHLKAIGIFARLNIRDGKSGYLADIPRTMNYLIAVAAKTEELKPIAGWLVQKVVPRMQQSQYFDADVLNDWVVE